MWLDVGARVLLRSSVDLFRHNPTMMQFAVKCVPRGSSMTNNVEREVCGALPSPPQQARPHVRQKAATVESSRETAAPRTTVLLPAACCECVWLGHG